MTDLSSGAASAPTTPRVFTLSGGKTTPANLFVNLSTKAVGILGTRKVVVFDEIAHTTFGDEDATGIAFGVERVEVGLQGIGDLLQGFDCRKIVVYLLIALNTI